MESPLNVIKGEFVRHCSIIFPRVRVSPPRLQELTQFQRSGPSKRRGSRKVPNGFMHYSSSSPFHCIRGDEGAKEKRSGVTNKRTHCRLIQLQHLEKTHPGIFYNRLKLQRAATLRSGQPLLSVCTAALSLSLCDLHSRNTPPVLVYVMRPLQLVLICEITGNGSQHEAGERMYPFFQSLHDSWVK